MEVVRATESVMYRIALCDCFGNKFSHDNNLIGCQEAAVPPPPKQSRDAIRHKADPVSRTSSTKTKKGLNLSFHLIGTKVSIKKLLLRLLLATGRHPSQEEV